MAAVAGLRGRSPLAIAQNLTIMKINASTFQSPLGEMLLLASESGLKGVYFQGQRYCPESDSAWQWDEAPFSATKHALEAYFTGETEVVIPPLDSQGTRFQQQVWQELRKIPSGRTCSYADIARGIGNPKAVRAVGAAIGRNPVSILVPCHRVVGTNGGLTGYAGGVDRKSWLLAHEGKCR